VPEITPYSGQMKGLVIFSLKRLAFNKWLSNFAQMKNRIDYIGFWWWLSLYSMR